MRLLNIPAPHENLCFCLQYVALGITCLELSKRMGAMQARHCLLRALCYRSTLFVVMLATQSRQSARLFLRSSELGLPTHSLVGECVPLFGLEGGVHSLAGKGVGAQFRRGYRHCGSSGIYVLCGWQWGLIAPACAEGSDPDPEFPVSIQINDLSHKCIWLVKN